LEDVKFATYVTANNAFPRHKISSDQNNLMSFVVHVLLLAAIIAMLAGVCRAQGDSVCGSVVDPVCGGGVTYTNPCYAMLANVAYVPGNCSGLGGDRQLVRMHCVGRYSAYCYEI
jgi:hypothetical protein